jgi:PKD repeat protein
MANLIYNSFKVDIANGSIDLDTDDIKVMLVTAAYTPSASHSKRSDITNEASGTGYTAGGQSLANKTVALVGTEGRFDADNAVWVDSSITAAAAVLYKSRGGAASADELVMYLDFEGNFTSVDADFTVQFNANGILGIDV